MKLNAGANVTLTAGIYYLDGGDLTMNGGATLTGSGGDARLHLSK